MIGKLCVGGADYPIIETDIGLAIVVTNDRIQFIDSLFRDLEQFVANNHEGADYKIQLADYKVQLMDVDQ